MKNRKLLYSGFIIVGALFLSFFDLPSDKQQELIPFTPGQILENKVSLGLDLQGGSQLDYKIDLRKVPNEDKNAVVDGILNVINRRVNSLGVAEPNIYTSDFGDEKHLIVELAGIKDLDEAKAVVGKTIQLEFKEQKENPEDPDLEKKVKEQAQTALDKANAGNDFSLLGKEEERANPGKVLFYESTEFAFKDDISANIREELFNLEGGQIHNELISNSGNITIDEDGNFVQGPEGFSIIKTVEKRDQEKTIENPREIKVSHVLVSYKGAEKADEEITRTEEEAKTRATEVIQKLNEGGEFSKIAEEYSDDKGSKVNGGALPDTASKDKGNYVKEFEDAAIALSTVGAITTEPVKSPFGFHVIKATEITEASSETKTEPQIKYASIYYSAAPDPWADTGLNGKHFVRADVQFTPTYQPYVSILFNDEGAKLFEELTKANIGKPIAIFVGGNLVSAPNVNETIAGGRAQISGQFTLEDAENLARDLNTGAIPAPISLAGQYSIGATLGQDALQKSIYASFIGLLLVSLFMIIYYRLPGILSVISLGIYSAILLFLIKVAMPIEVALAISIFIFVFLILKILKNKESGAEKAITAILACFILFFATFILATPVVLTLAGIAGVILSIGMAVDANILIFERIKEELRDGRSLGAAIEVGFDRAWSSIRDSNFSSLITCGILFYFGSSIIQGFAFNLAAGILISMLTAITITKTFLIASAGTSLGKNLMIFGAPKKKDKKLIQIIPNRKKFYALSGVLLILILIGIPVAGMKLGLDFTGGTLMQLKFQQEVSTDQIRDALVASQDNIQNGNASNPVVEDNNAVEATTTTTEEADTAEHPAAEEEITDEAEVETSETTENIEETSEAEETSTATEEPVATSTAIESDSSITSSQEPIDFSNAQIVPSEDGFLIKTSHISTAAHDQLLIELKNRLGEFEEIRFSTVGPTVGSSLQQKAVFAVLLAVVMIILYVAFAFRKVPRSIGKWRFGLTAIAALVHDLLIMIGVYVFLGVFLGVEIDALFITAMLTVLGFSVHDTIVVFDRLRENLKYQKRDETFAEVTNKSLNDTMARSINTSLSTLVVLLMLAIFGSESIRYFVVALIVGIISGTYSSIFVGTPLLVDWLNLKRKR